MGKKNRRKALSSGERSASTPASSTASAPSSNSSPTSQASAIAPDSFDFSMDLDRLLMVGKGVRAGMELVSERQAAEEAAHAGRVKHHPESPGESPVQAEDHKESSLVVSSPNEQTIVSQQKAQYFPAPSKYVVWNMYENPPSRVLIISGIPLHLSDSQILFELEYWGPIRAFSLGARAQGLVTVYFYDLRHAERALAQIRSQNYGFYYLHQNPQPDQGFRQLCLSQSEFNNETVGDPKNKPKPRPYDPVKHELENVGIVSSEEKTISPAGSKKSSFSASAAPFVSGMQYHPQASSVGYYYPGTVGGAPIWAQYGEPAPFVNSDDGYNQGTLLLFFPGAATMHLTREFIRSVFQAYGDVKEVREAMNWKHKFIEYFDTRDAAKAKEALDGTDIGGFRVKVDFSRQSRHRRPPVSTYSFVDPSPACYYGSFNYDPRFTSPGQYYVPSSYPDMVYYAPYFPWYYVPVAPSLPSRGLLRAPPPKLISNGSTGKDGGYERGYKSTNSRGYFGTRLNQKRISADPPSQYSFNAGEAENDGRTTLMIRNVPNKYSPQLLLQVLDEHCFYYNTKVDVKQHLSAYDFLYLPVDFANECNLGYAFINFTAVTGAIRLYEDFHNHRWELFSSRKVCEITYARIQGRADLQEHFKKSKFAYICQKEWLPQVFDPPRTGLELSGMMTRIRTLSPAPSESDGRQSTTDVEPGIHQEDEESSDAGFG